MRQQLDEVWRAYLALSALLESRLLPPATRKQLEEFRDDLERDIDFLQRNVKQMTANWPSYRP